MSVEFFVIGQKRIVVLQNIYVKFTLLIFFYVHVLKYSSNQEMHYILEVSIVLIISHD